MQVSDDPGHRVLPQATRLILAEGNGAAVLPLQGEFIHIGCLCQSRFKPLLSSEVPAPHLLLRTRRIIRLQSASIHPSLSRKPSVPRRTMGRRVSQLRVDLVRFGVALASAFPRLRVTIYMPLSHNILALMFCIVQGKSCGDADRSDSKAGMK